MGNRGKKVREFLFFNSVTLCACLSLFFGSYAYSATVSQDMHRSSEKVRREMMRRYLARIENSAQELHLASGKDTVVSDTHKEEAMSDKPSDTQEDKSDSSRAQDTRQEEGKEKKNLFKKLNVHGFLKTRHYFNTERHTDRRYYELRNDLRLERLFDVSKSMKAKVSLDGQYDAVDTKALGYNVEEERVKLWEAYANLSIDKWDIRIGQQVIRWGKSDELNPTDVFTPEDFSELVNKNLRAERKIPVPALKADYYYEPSSAFELIWVPIFVKNKLGENGSNWEPYIKKYYNNLFIPTLLGPYPIELAESTLPKRFDNSSVALKWLHTGERLDYSFSYSYHPDENPSYHLSLNETKVFEKHLRQHTVGGDFETVIGKLGIRGEGAFTTKRNYVNTDPLDEDKIFRKDAFVSVLGADYTFGGSLYCNLQYASELVFDPQEFMIEQDFSDSVLWKISRKFLRDKFMAETTGRYFLSRRDYFCRFSVAYEFTDNLKCSTGVDFFGGEFTSTFGQFRKNDQTFLRVEYSF